MARPLLTGGGPCAILADMTTRTKVGFPDDFPMNRPYVCDDGEILAKMDADYAREAIELAKSNGFVVLYEDDMAFIASSANDDSLGAFVLTPEGHWEARLNVRDEEDKQELLVLAEFLKVVRDLKALGL